MSRIDLLRHPRFWIGLAALLLVALLAGQSVSALPSASASSATPQARSTSASSSAPMVGQDVRHDVSPPLASIPPIKPGPGVKQIGDRSELERRTSTNPTVKDPVVQTLAALPGALGMPALSRSFEGIYNYWGYYPPDTNGDVGPNNYVQIVNVGFQIFSKRGATLYGPADINTLWQGFGGICQTSTDGDPLVLYDSMADRWVLSQFAVPGGAQGYHQCVAVSTSGDPTGAWYRYDFLISSTLFNDYPKMGVWPDGYYTSFDMFRNNTYLGSEPVVFDRARMLQGQPATFQSFPPDNKNSTMLPADLDGAALPPAGEPGIFATVDINGSAHVRFFNFHVDWANPANSTFTASGTVAVAPFNIPCLSTHNCIPQPGTSQKLDALSDRLMYRLAYRNFGDHQALVTNHTVDVANGGQVNTGVRWYEFRSPAGASFVPSLYQQGTYAPDGDSRWMGSVAMDHSGDIAAGYSVSGAGTYPSIRYAGRLASDPLGQLAQGEATLMAGSGAQTGVDGRWGDYSMMSVDPSDDCTFWYTQEYYSVTGDRNWRTRIGSFKFRGCQSSPVPVPTNTPGPSPTNTPTPQPTATACANSVTYSGSITTSDPTEAGRLNRDGVASSCASPKTCPGQYDTAPRHYRRYNYTNTTGSPQCVTATVVENCGDNALLSATYLNVFDPNNLCSNYLADMGVAGPTFSYSFTLPAGATAVVVVEEAAANVGCTNFTLTLNPCATSR